MATISNSLINDSFDPIVSCVLPSLANSDLCHFALTSHSSKVMCISEISKRAVGKTWLEAGAFLIRKMELFLHKEEGPVVKKIHEILQRFTDNSPCSFNRFFTSPPSHPIVKHVSECLESYFKIPEWREIKDDFYLQLYADGEDQAVISQSITFLVDHEMSCRSRPSIPIDVSRPSLSLGALACFSVAQKRLMGKELSVYDRLSPKGSYEQECHQKIVLCSSASGDEETPSKEYLSELDTHMSLLSEIRLLELNMFVDPLDRRVQSCFESLLLGASSLPKLRGVIFSFGKASDDQIFAVTELVKKRLARDLFLEYIGIHCIDMEVRHVITLLTELRSCKKKIQLDLCVSYHSEHRIELGDFVDNRTDDETIELNFRFLI